MYRTFKTRIMILNGKKVDKTSIEIDVNTKDYPDFCDSLITYAEYEDGTVLTDEETEQLQNDYDDEFWELCYDKFIS